MNADLDNVLRFLFEETPRPAGAQHPYDTPLVLPIPGKLNSQAFRMWFLMLVAGSSGPTLPKSQPLPTRVRHSGLRKRWEAFFRMNVGYQTTWEAIKKGSLSFFEFHTMVLQILGDMDGIAAADGKLSGTSYKSIITDTLSGTACLAPPFHVIRSGITVEPTRPLAVWLKHSDIGLDLPASFLRPPASHVYLLLDPEENRVQGTPWRFEGVYCFAHDLENGGRNLDLFLISEATQDKGKMGFSLHITIEDEQTPLVTLVDQVMRMVTPGPGLEEALARIKTAVREQLEYLLKVFLYMSLPETRRVTRNEWSEWETRLARLGPKKAAKLRRKPMDGVYDRIEVGPLTWPEITPGGGDGGYEVSPHWRRGHFRHQAYGPRNQERKLIFVQPMIVRADRLKAEEG